MRMVEYYIIIRVIGDITKDKLELKDDYIVSMTKIKDEYETKVKSAFYDISDDINNYKKETSSYGSIFLNKNQNDSEFFIYYHRLYWKSTLRITVGIFFPVFTLKFFTLLPRFIFLYIRIS